MQCIGYSTSSDLLSFLVVATASKLCSHPLIIALYVVCSAPDTYSGGGVIFSNFILLKIGLRAAPAPSGFKQYPAATQSTSSLSSSLPSSSLPLLSGLHNASQAKIQTQTLFGVSRWGHIFSGVRPETVFIFQSRTMAAAI